MIPCVMINAFVSKTFWRVLPSPAPAWPLLSMLLSTYPSAVLKTVTIMNNFHGDIGILV